MRKIMYILLLFIVAGCGTSERKRTDSIVEKPYKYASMKDNLLHLDLLNSKKDSSVLKLSQVVDSLIYIPLETSKECLLKNHIHKICIDEDNIFLQDGWYVYNYDISGK